METNEKEKEIKGDSAYLVIRNNGSYSEFMKCFGR